ncbi:MAG TPA: ABC transporter permease [Bryobacteraceae bacterium]|nr:ABC transporter permease [Bryobacteraceae bacterium]
MTTRLRVLLLSPSALLLAVLFGFPLGIIFVYSLKQRGAYGGVTAAYTLENFMRLWDPLYAMVFVRTLVVATLATFLCIALAFPTALFLARSGKSRRLWLQLVLLPFWTSFLIRLYAWVFLLRDTGPVNALLAWAGLVAAPVPLLYNDGAVVLGLVYGYLPFAVLPMYAVLERLDPDLEHAAADLGATPVQIVRSVVWPQALPGVRSASVLVFIASLGAYLVPDLLGGAKSLLAGNLIQNQFTTARDWPFGSALALVTMAFTAALLIAVRRRLEHLL